MGNAIRTNITYESLFPGIWPAEYEVREAARFGNYNWTEWCELPSWEQADVIAHYRIHHLIEIHQGDVQAREIDRRMKAKQNGTQGLRR